MFCHFLYTWLEVNNKGLKIASWSDGVQVQVQVFYFSKDTWDT